MPRIPLALVVVAVLAPSSARSAGGHDSVGCVGCHAEKKVDPGTARFCFQCHASKAEGGRDILPISAHMSHPFGLATINPRVAKVPAAYLRADGSFQCLSCHDPHPSNANHAYLRADTGKEGQRMDAFCAVCHPAKSDQAPASATPKAAPRT